MSEVEIMNKLSVWDAAARIADAAGRAKDNAQADIAAIITAVLALLEDCDQSREEIVLRASGGNVTLVDRVRVYNSLRSLGFRGGRLRNASKEFWVIAQSRSQHELAAMLEELEVV